MASLFCWRCGCLDYPHSGPDIPLTLEENGISPYVAALHVYGAGKGPLLRSGGALPRSFPLSRYHPSSR